MGESSRKVWVAVNVSQYRGKTFRQREREERGNIVRMRDKKERKGENIVTMGYEKERKGETLLK